MRSTRPSRRACRITSPAACRCAISLSVLHRIRWPIVGADMVEYNPHRDINGMTAVVAAKLVKELAALTAKGRQKHERFETRTLIGGAVAAAAAAALPFGSGPAPPIMRA